MFNADGKKLYEAQTNLGNASSQLLEALSISGEITSFPPEFEWSGEINQIISDLNSANADVSEIIGKILGTINMLCSMYPEFAQAYYSCVANDFSETDFCDMDSEQYVNSAYLYSFLQYLESEGKLPDELRKTYENLSQNNRLSEVDSELARYEKALNDMMYLTDGAGNVKPTDIDRDEFGNVITTAKQRGDRFLATQQFYKKRIEELKKEQEALQRATGTYQNKWYEDIWESIQKTGAAWTNVYTTAKNGGSAGDVMSATWDATKQTVSTGAVCVESAYSGVKKIEEWIGDGAVAIGGTIVAGGTWLFHDTWSDNDLADDVMDGWLDYVRIDQVGEARKQFYENNKIGKWINDNSNLKYDSAGAEAISKASRVVGEIAIATGATIATGGTATPAVVTTLFALEGAGESTESYARSVDRKKGESYNYGSALLSEAVGGFGGAMKAQMYGKIGSNVFKIAQNPSIIPTAIDAIKQTGAKTILKNELKSTSFWVDTGMTAMQKTSEVVNEYNATGTVNWGKAATSFVGELLLARATDKILSNNINEAINPMSIKETKAMIKNVGNSIKKDGLTSSFKNIFVKKDLTSNTNVNLSEMNVDDANYYFSTLTNSEKRAKRLEDVSIFGTFDSGAKQRLKDKHKMYNELFTREVCKQDMYSVNKKLGDFYSQGELAGKTKGFLLGFEEHNFAHVTRVADESKNLSILMNDMIQNGKLDGYAAINPEIIHKAGLAHDLGMKDGGFYHKDSIMTKIEDEYGTIIRKNHPLNSAITVLENKDIFGDDSDMIACLALIHSKSTSGVKDVESTIQLSEMVKTLYENQTIEGKKMYSFDPSKFVECSADGTPILKTIKNGEKEILTYTFKNGVAEELKTGAVALRVGDAHATKTGFNQGGAKINIEVRPDAKTTLKKFKNEKSMDIDALCNFEAELSKISIIDGDNIVNLSGTPDYDFSRRIVLGEANSYTLPVKENGDGFRYTHVVKSTDTPANTWQHGISEKFGEYKTFKGIDQTVDVVLPKESSNQLVQFYKKLAQDYVDQNEWLKINILRKA